MKKPQPQTEHYAGPFYRTISVLFALALLAAAGYVIVGQPADALQVAGGILIFALGANLLLSAIRGKASWLSKIGPLP